MLRGVDRQLVIEISGHSISLIFKRKALHQSTLHNIPDEHKPHLRCGGSLKSREEEITLPHFKRHSAIKVYGEMDAYLHSRTARVSLAAITDWSLHPPFVLSVFMME